MSKEAIPGQEPTEIKIEVTEYMRAELERMASKQGRTLEGNLWWVLMDYIRETREEETEWAQQLADGILS